MQIHSLFIFHGTTLLCGNTTLLGKQVEENEAPVHKQCTDDWVICLPHLVIAEGSKKMVVGAFILSVSVCLLSERN